MKLPINVLNQWNPDFFAIVHKRLNDFFCRDVLLFMRYRSPSLFSVTQYHEKHWGPPTPYAWRNYWTGPYRKTLSMESLFFTNIPAQSLQLYKNRTPLQVIFSLNFLYFFRIAILYNTSWRLSFRLHFPNFNTFVELRNIFFLCVCS